MLKNYFTLAYRNLLKNKVASLVSVMGLAIAIGCSIVAYMFVSGMIMSETLHENADTIYQVQVIHEVDGETFIHGRTPDPLGPQILRDHPTVKRSIRFQEAQLSFLHNDNEFHNLVRFVDPGYLDMFTIPMKYGSKDVLRDPDALILSEEHAIKYFGDSNPIGLSLTIKSNSGELKSYTVKGVAEGFEMQSVANFSMLTAYENYPSLVHSEVSETESIEWSNLAWATFLQLETTSDKPVIESKLAMYVDVYNANVQADTQIQGYKLDNLNNLIFSAREVRGAIRGGLPMAPIILLGTITLFLFTLACFNYINISLGAANARVKEIGIRKAIGSRKWQLIGQFLVENVLLCFVSLVAGIILAMTLLLPAFGAISGQLMHLEFARRLDLWQFLGGTLLITALISGAYPAFYLASFKPVAIFTGKFKSGGPNRFMQTLLTGQFVLAFVTMIMCVGFSLNLSYLKNLDWGYDNQHTLVVKLNPDWYDFMYDEASQLAQVTHVSGAQNHVGTWYGNRVSLEKAGLEQEAVQFSVGDQYMDIIQPRLVAGVFPTQPDHIVINQSLASLLGPGDVVGQNISQDENEYLVSGIVEDFHYSDFSDFIEPAIFVQGDASTFGYLVARMQPGSEQEVVTALAAALRKLEPTAALDHYFQHESFDRFFQEGNGINQIFYFTAIVALLLSCAGLYGLVAQHTNSKLKEMSIRKILGASISQILQLGNRKFVVILLIAATIASPISYMLLGILLDSFIDYRMNIGPTPFVIAISLTALIAIATIASQAQKLIKVNPAELLRHD